MKHKAALLAEYLKNVSFMWPFVSAAGLVCGLLAGGEAYLPFVIAAAVLTAGLSAAGRTFNYLLLFGIGLGFFCLGVHFHEESRQIREEIMQPLEYGFVKGHGRIEKIRAGPFSTLLTVSAPCRIRGRSVRASLILDIDRKYAADKFFSVGMQVSYEGLLRPSAPSASYGRAEGSSYKIKVKKLKPPAAYSPSFADRCRGRLAAKSAQSFNGETSAVVSALFLGQSSFLSQSQRDLFAKAGISHIFAASGFHINMIAGFTLFICISVRINKRRAVFIILPLCFFYSLLAGSSPSVQRAFFMIALLSGALLAGRPGQSLRLIFAAALLMLLLSRDLIYSLSFQLSFAAVLGIALWFRPLMKLTPLKVKFISESLSLSVSALSTTLPILASRFGFIAPASLPAGLLAVPAVYIILLAAAPILFINLPLPLAAPLILLTEATVGGLTSTCAELALLLKPLAINSISAKQCFIYYTVLLIGKILLSIYSDDQICS
ncbi:ComEC/Rec2 family competence protein [bacterium]|nr:ComEC/Rec2 family competence protein [bacterium]